jgi:hypothetical protein
MALEAIVGYDQDWSSLCTGKRIGKQNGAQRKLLFLGRFVPSAFEAIEARNEATNWGILSISNNTAGARRSGPFLSAILFSSGVCAKTQGARRGWRRARESCSGLCGRGRSQCSEALTPGCNFPARYRRPHSRTTRRHGTLHIRIASPSASVDLLEPEQSHINTQVWQTTTAETRTFPIPKPPNSGDDYLVYTPRKCEMRRREKARDLFSPHQKKKAKR